MRSFRSGCKTTFSAIGKSFVKNKKKKYLLRNIILYLTLFDSTGFFVLCVHAFSLNVYVLSFVATGDGTKRSKIWWDDCQARDFHSLTAARWKRCELGMGKMFFNLLQASNRYRPSIISSFSSLQNLFAQLFTHTVFSQSHPPQSNATGHSLILFYFLPYIFNEQREIVAKRIMLDSRANGMPVEERKKSSEKIKKYDKLLWQGATFQIS